MTSYTDTFNELFNKLDVNKDGKLSRAELHDAAQQMGWYWHEAPLLALLDLFTVIDPVPRNSFIDYMEQIAEDPLGPYGRVLLNAPHFMPGRKNHVQESCNNMMPYRKPYENKASILINTSGPDAADDYQELLESLENTGNHVSADEAAVLIIDPQRSFTHGVWMRSMGEHGENEVKPIKLAFNKCTRFLAENYSRVETMFTRCPFPPDSYGWYEKLGKVISSTQLYFIKPGNSVMFPPSNGFKEWMEGVIKNGKQMLVIGGCTLNSCVRVSSIEVQQYVKGRLQVVVDLSLCGARSRNYARSSIYNGLSAVETAVREMKGEGVMVVGEVEWG